MDERRQGILQGLVDARGVPLAPPPAPTIERSPVDGLEALLEVMGQVADGAVDFNGIEIGPEACRELLRLIDESETHRQQSESHLRLVDQARRERDEYLGKLSEVAAERDRAQGRVNVLEHERDRSRASYDKMATERDELRRREAEVIAARDCACAERDLARDKADLATKMAQRASEARAVAETECDELRARVRQLEAWASRTVLYQGSAADTLREACRQVRTGVSAVLIDGEACRRMFDELLLEADRAELEPDDAEPPRHLHCCECEQCQPPQRGCLVINVYGGHVEVHS